MNGLNAREHLIARCTRTRELPYGARITVTAALIHMRGDEMAHFTVTGSFTQRRVGSVHGAIADLAREYIPELTPVCALHLADENGVPMGAVENGAHWLGFTGAGKCVDLDAFSLLWRVSVGEARRIYVLCHGAESPMDALTVEAERRSVPWAIQANTAYRVIVALSDAEDAA
jgi:hypothetical protein